MSVWTYVQIECIPFLTLALTLYIAVKEFSAIRNIRRFQWLTLLVMCVVAVDTFNWYTVLRPLAFPAFVLWISNVVYFLLSDIISFLWFLYVFHQVYPKELTRRQEQWLRLSVIPLVLVCAVIVSTPWTGAIFRIDPRTQAYARGSLHVLQAACGFVYMLAASVLAWQREKKMTLPEEKSECRFLCHVVLLPILGGVLQMINYNFVFLWSFTAAAAFLMFIDFQSHWVSIDPLTALNNRGNLEQYLDALARERRLTGYLMMIDVDRFKAINDRYGHIEGDRALRIVALALKNVFGSAGAFLSRYGGDEFVVVAELADPEATIIQCETELRRQKMERALPYEIHLSVGYVRCEQERADHIGELIRQADQSMYERKNARGAG